MDFISEVKTRVDIIAVARAYGIELNRSGFCCCPFHSEKTPSMSISRSKQIFKCFGCGKAGDVVTLVAELYNIRPFEAAKNINQVMSLGVELPEFKRNFREKEYKVNHFKSESSGKERFKEWDKKTFCLLSKYLRTLKEWKNIYDPNFENELHVKALKEIDYIENLIETVFIYGTEEDKLWFKKTKGKEMERIGRELKSTNS